MARLTRMHSFLDRFDERMQVDCQRLKRQLLAQVDERFGVLREKVAQLRNQFGCAGQSRSARSAQLELSDDPPMETLQLDECLQEQSAMVESIRDVPSTSTGLKRKSSSESGTVTNKRQKDATSSILLIRINRSNKLLCKSPGCGKSFADNAHLVVHERIHLNVKPFFCTWPGCRYSAVQKGDVVKHVRTQHFKLPELKKEQTRLNIIDNRNPEDYVRVDRDLLQRRLE